MATRLHFLLTSIPRKLAVVGCALIVVQGLASSACAAAPAKKGRAVPSAAIGANALAQLRPGPRHPRERRHRRPIPRHATRSASLRSGKRRSRISSLAGRPDVVRRCAAGQADQGPPRGRHQPDECQPVAMVRNGHVAKLKVLSSDQAREAEAYLATRLRQSPRRRTSASFARSFPTC